MALVTFFTAAQFATPPKLIAVASGLTTGVRSLGGSIGLPIFNALFASGLAKKLVPKVTAAVIPLGLPEISIALLIDGLSAGNMTLVESLRGVTPDIIEAAGLAVNEAYSVGFRNIFISGAAFMVVGIIRTCQVSMPKDPVTAFLRNPSSEFNAKIYTAIDILPENNDVENELKAATSQRVENNEG
jgi:hypothetical protein